MLCRYLTIKNHLGGNGGGQTYGLGHSCMRGWVPADRHRDLASLLVAVTPGHAQFVSEHHEIGLVSSWQLNKTN